MITKITDKNQFNSDSWQIKMSSLLHIFIHKTNNKSYLFEFKEWKLFSYKTHFSFTSNDNIESAIIDFFGKLYEFIERTQKWEIDYLKFESFKFKTISYFNENHKDISGTVYSPEEQTLIKALNYYKEQKHDEVYNTLKKETNLLNNNLDALLLLIDSTVKLSNPEKKNHDFFYPDADNFLFDLHMKIESNKIYMNEKQKNKYLQIVNDFKKIPFPTELYTETDYFEPFGKIEPKKTEIKPIDKALFEADEQIKIGNLNEAYKILSITNLTQERDVSVLFELATLSIIMRKTDEIQGHLLALIVERSKGKFTSEQESEFNSVMDFFKNSNDLK